MGGWEVVGLSSRRNTVCILSDLCHSYLIGSVREMGREGWRGMERWREREGEREREGRGESVCSLLVPHV